MCLISKQQTADTSFLYQRLSPAFYTSVCWHQHFTPAFCTSVLQCLTPASCTIILQCLTPAFCTSVSHERHQQRGAVSSIGGVDTGQEQLPVIRSRNTAGPANNLPLHFVSEPFSRKLELAPLGLYKDEYCTRLSFSPVCSWTFLKQRLARRGVDNGGGTPRTVGRDDSIEQFKKISTISLKINPWRDIMVLVS